MIVNMVEFRPSKLDFEKLKLVGFCATCEHQWRRMEEFLESDLDVGKVERTVAGF